MMRSSDFEPNVLKKSFANVVSVKYMWETHTGLVFINHVNLKRFVTIKGAAING